MVILLLLMLAVALASQHQFDLSLDDRSLFDDYLNIHNRLDEYPDYDYTLRFARFQQTLSLIRESQNKGHATFHINRFSDRFEDELKQLHSSPFIPEMLTGTTLAPSSNGVPQAADVDSMNLSPMSEGDLPTSVDLRDYNLVTPIRNQLGCGSCWAFATLSLVESGMLLQGMSNDSTNLDLSEQYLVNCDHTSGGCSGGNFWNSAPVIGEYGIPDEAVQPYLAVDTKSCSYTGASAHMPLAPGYPRRIGRWSDGFTGFTDEQDRLVRTYLAKGLPVAVIIAIPDDFYSYSGGIYDPKTWTPAYDHQVALVGYGVELGKPYWLLRNSWGDTWGLDGYMKIRRGLNTINVEDHALVAALISWSDTGDLFGEYGRPWFWRFILVALVIGALIVAVYFVYSRCHKTSFKGKGRMIKDSPKRPQRAVNHVDRIPLRDIPQRRTYPSAGSSRVGQLQAAMGN